MDNDPHSSTVQMPAHNVLLKQYEIMVDTYHKYLDITLKFVIFTYAVTGGILSYYLSRPAQGVMKFALIFPTLLNAVFGVSCFVAAKWNKPIVEEIENVTTDLNLRAYPDPRFLIYVLNIFGYLHIAITLALLTVTIVRFTD